MRSSKATDNQGTNQANVIQPKHYSLTTHIPKENLVLKNFTSMLRDEEGQGLVEYALIIALVSIVAIAALKLLGNKANNTLTNAAGSLS